MNMIIIGCGRMGAGLAQLLSLRGHAVTVVDNNKSAFANLGRAFKGQTVVGIGFDRDVLHAAGITRADGLAAVTNSDETNIVTARVAREHYHVPRVVARVVEPHKAEIYQRLGLQTISTTAWGIDRVANLLSYTELDVILTLGNQVELVQAEIPPVLAGRTAYDLTIPGELQVVAIQRQGRTFLPTNNVTFQTGDLLHLAVQAASADRVKALLRAG